MKSKVLFKCLMMRFTAIQCGGPTFKINWLTKLTVNKISTLVFYHYIHKRFYPTFLVQNPHLHPTFLQFFGGPVNFHVPLAISESYTSCIVAFHLLASSDINALQTFKRSSKNATLALNPKPKILNHILLLKYHIFIIYDFLSLQHLGL